MPTNHANPAVDAYLAKAAPFAQPILTHLRALVHKACPEVVEEIKWSRPFFVHRDIILCNLSAFKSHCAFGFWGAEISRTLHADGVVKEGAMGSLGRIASLQDLPPDRQLVAYIRKAAGFIEAGQGETFIAVSRRVVKAPKTPVEPTAEFSAALKKSKAATAVFAAFSPSCKREYIEWIASAKQPATRDRRVAQAIAQIAEGKQHNWRYESR